MAGAVRWKQTKRQSYFKHPRAHPSGRRTTKRPHIGIKATSAEYVVAGRIICKQRKYIARNPYVRKKRHFKIYPGVGVTVMRRTTSLHAQHSGRVKMTHDVERDVMVMNVLPEPHEELLREDLWRYRTEHVASMEENKFLCHLRTKALPTFGKESGWVNQTIGPRPMSVRVSHRQDTWNNPMVKDPLDLEPFAYPLPRHLLARHIRRVRRKQAGLPDDDADFHVKDVRFPEFMGQTAQR